MRSAGSSGRREGTGAVADPRQESLPERDDRNLAELIQELRVVSLGVQVLFGFLLSLPFTVRFSRLGAGQRDLYLASLVLSATATILLLGPVAYHRLVFRQGLKESLVRYANVMAILGLASVGAAVLTAVLLVISFVAGLLPGVLITAVMACALAGLWFVQPLIRRGDKLASTTDPPQHCPPSRASLKNSATGRIRRAALPANDLPRRGFAAPCSDSRWARQRGTEGSWIPSLTSWPMTTRKSGACSGS